MPEFPSGTVTFLFTDVEGSTKRWEADTPAMQAVVERHFALLDEAIASNEGVRFKIIGDAVQAAFPTARHGVLAAVQAQRALQAEDWGALGPLRVRMALHTGAATPRDGDYLAPSLNRLARLLSSGAGSQILVTEVTRNLVRDDLPAELALRDLGEHRLRDLRETERVYQLVGPGLPDDFPPLKSLDRPLHNLPAQLSTFIGRESEIAEVLARLAQPGIRLLTLTGPGGTGKTRLSLQVATEQIGHYADGVWFVALAPVATPVLVASTIAETLGVRESPGEGIEITLRDFLRPKQMLLVLDNFEHVVAAAPLVASLLAECPSLQILATSRAPLRIAGEAELPIDPLEVPSGADDADLDQAQSSEAVRLFIDRAQAVRGGFALTEQNAATITRICQRLDGLPLAIELAAARTRLLSPEAILARLDHRLTLLTGGGRERPERQQTLRAAVAWSHDLLGPDDQAFFRRLSVFAGGWTLEAAEAVASAAPTNIDALDALSALNDNSLIRQRETETGEYRFAMLQTIREFGEEQLGISGEEDAIRDAHAAYFMRLASDAEPHLTGREAIAWLDRLDADHDNLRAALAWLRQQEDAVGAVRLAGALWRFWWLRGHLSEGRSELEAALDTGAAADSTTERATALDGAGILAETQGDYDRAETLHRQALAISRNLDDLPGTARALGNLGVVAFDRGDFQNATALLEESLALARTSDDRDLIATALNDLGRVAYDQGERARAETLYLESLELRRQLGSSSEIARALNNIGYVAFDLGDFGRARELFDESLGLYRESGDRWGAAAPLNGLAVSIQRGGDIPRAMALLEESLALFHETGDARNEAVTLQNLAGAARDGGDNELAVRYFRAALTGFHAVADRAGIVAALVGLGAIMAQTEQRAAVTLLGVATKLADETETGYPPAQDDAVQADLDRARAALGDEAFTAAWEAGQSLSIDAAVAAALAGSDGPRGVRGG